jgi:hypothetical protein
MMVVINTDAYGNFLLFHLLSSATAVVTAAHAPAVVAPVSPATAATLQKITLQAISKHTQVLICYFMITLYVVWEGYEWGVKQASVFRCR